MKRAISFLLQINGFPIQLYSCNNCIMRKYFLMAYFILSVCLCVSVCVCVRQTEGSCGLVLTHACVKSFVGGTCQSLHPMQNTLITSANA